MGNELLALTIENMMNGSKRWDATRVLDEGDREGLVGIGEIVSVSGTESRCWHGRRSGAERRRIARRGSRGNVIV